MAPDKPAAIETSPAPNSRVKEEPIVPEAQSMTTHFGLYKCEVCGKIVIGFDRENHAREEHKRKIVELRNVR